MSTAPLTSILRHGYIFVVWDIHTGVVINTKIVTASFGNIVFFGHQGSIVCHERLNLRVYDGLNGALLSESILSSSDMGAVWACGETLRVAVILDPDYDTHHPPEYCTVNIHEFWPTTSNHTFPIVESFSVPFVDGDFSFSPVSFHASFVTRSSIVVLKHQ